MSFLFEKEQNDKMSFLDEKISQEIGTFVTTLYWKPIFSGAYTQFESFLPSTHKFNMLYTLVYRCFTLCTDLKKIHRKLYKEITIRHHF